MARGKQMHLPGQEPPIIKEIDDAAENYNNANLKRVKLSEKEKEAQVSLNEAMLKADLKRYVTANGMIVVRTEKSKCEVEFEDENKKDGDEKDE